MNELISIIIPVYNCEKYIEECIDSILNQTYDNLEIVLVDDGSRDESGKICDEYANGYSDDYNSSRRSFKVIHKDNEGACYARRDGLEAATSEIIMFVDGDDWIDTDMVSELAKSFFDNNADIITSGFDEGIDNKIFDSFEPGIYENELLDALKKSVIYDVAADRIGMLMTVCGRLFKKSLLLPVMMQLPANIRLWEDLTYCYIPFFHAKKIIVTHKAYYHYRNNEESTSKKHREGEYEKMAYSFSVARANYSKYGEQVFERISLLETKLYNTYIWNRLRHCDKDIVEIMEELDAMRSDERFIEPVSLSISKLSGKWDKKLILDLLDKNSEKVVSDYYKYQMVRAFFASRFYKAFQGSFLYVCIRKIWRLVKR